MMLEALFSVLKMNIPKIVNKIIDSVKKFNTKRDKAGLFVCVVMGIGVNMLY